MNGIERNWVATIALSLPSLSDSNGPASEAMPTVTLPNANIVPTISDVAEYRSLKNTLNKGMINPAPKPTIADHKRKYVTVLFSDLSGSILLIYCLLKRIRFPRSLLPIAIVTFGTLVVLWLSGIVRGEVGLPVDVFWAATHPDCRRLYGFGKTSGPSAGTYPRRSRESYQ
jgi:hypothetical protein